MMNPLEKYNLREKVNIIGGALLGFAIPTAVVRYGVFGHMKPNSFLTYIATWGFSAILASPLSIPCALGGLGAGIFSANSLQGKGLEKIVGDKK